MARPLCRAAQAYPFLAQVCRHWKAVLESREALPALWEDLAVDFSHELITGRHFVAGCCSCCCCCGRNRTAIEA